MVGLNLIMARELSLPWIWKNGRSIHMNLSTFIKLSTLAPLGPSFYLPPTDKLTDLWLPVNPDWREIIILDRCSNGDSHVPHANAERSGEWSNRGDRRNRTVQYDPPFLILKLDQIHPHCSISPLMTTACTHAHTLVRDVQYRSLSVISECLLPRLWRTLGADNLPRSNDRLSEMSRCTRAKLGLFALARVSSCHGLPWVLPTNVEFCPRNMTPRDHGGGRRHAFYSDLVSAAFPLSVSGNFPQVFTLTDHLWEPCELFQCVSSSTRRLREVQILVDAMWPLTPPKFSTWMGPPGCMMRSELLNFWRLCGRFFGWRVSTV